MQTINGDFSVPLERFDDEDASATLSPRLAYMSMFDAYVDPLIGYSHGSLFESHNPGALTSLYAWASARDLVISQRQVDGAELDVHNVKLSHGGFVEVYARRGVKP